MKDLDLLPHKWWDFIRAGECTLAPITCCILVQECSTSSCEHNWNSYSFVHSKVWNQLTSNWAEDLVYICINNKLLEKWHGTNPMAWYEKNILFKVLMSNVDESVKESDSSSKGANA